MSLTKQDLQNIENIVDRTVERKIKDLPTKADVESIVGSAIEKSESRIVSAMGLLERDTFARFEDHEQRIARLEKKLTSS